MENQEQPKKFLYPNSDRGENYNKDNLPENKPLVHMSDIMAKPGANTENKVSAIHTFKDDVSQETSKDGFSVTNILLANQKAKDNNRSNDLAKKDGGGWKILLALLFGIIIIAAFSYIGYKTAKTPGQIQAINNPSQKLAGSMLYAEESYKLNIKDKDRTSIYSEIIQNGQDSKITNGKIKSIYFSYAEGTSSAEIKASDFLEIMAPSAPDVLKRNIKDNYVFGFYAYETNHPFMIFKAENYDSTFAGMLEWEKTMYADIGNTMFKKDIENKLISGKNNNVDLATNSASTSISTIFASSTTATTTTKASSTQNIKTNSVIASSTNIKKPTNKLITEYETPFVDKVIKNNDTRVLYRPNGQIAFFYTFFNKDTIIITVSEQALNEVIYRLTSGQITR